ncbi:Twitching mobility protein [bacterium HR17]|uniref:Twitching mobility protein n=1 Tax=Candidatus Fervidibacter japonicus TaxID=2035412 RepID=A0A2H5XA83_9BACT|nr:Twitching mobility protein [bacterium HR17]
MALHLNDILTELVQRDGSDLHLKVGQPPFFRVHGRLTRTDYPTLTPDLIRELIYAILTDEQIRRLEERRELDMAYELPNISRFRVNLFHQQGYLGGVFRVIPSRIRTIDDLGLPQVLKQIALLRRGLVLVTGPTGSGKTTTLAAIVDYINEHRRAHIITIEEPIEYWHDDKLASITQREVGADTESFAEALRHVMRQNPDVILVGEMRDLETIALAITAAETGHLVFSTVHTIDAPQTIDRIIDAFDPDRQPQVRVQLSTTLQAVISQQLVPRCDRPGRVAAMEIMIVTPAVRSLIRQGRTDQIYSHIKAGSEIGCQMLDDHLFQLVKDGVVSFEDAFMKCSNPTEFKARMLDAGLITAEQAAAFATM